MDLGDESIDSRGQQEGRHTDRQ